MVQYDEYEYIVRRADAAAARVGTVLVQYSYEYSYYLTGL